MAVFSPSLDQSLRRALAIAGERRHARAMLDHLLLALTDDPDAAAVMRGCNVDIEKLRRTLDSSLVDLKEGTTANGEANLDSEVQAIIQAAVIHVESIGREVVTGAHVLVEISDKWPSPFLQGMTRYDAASFICHGIAKQAGASAMGDGEGAMPSGPEDASKSSMFKVLLLNDDYTPMEFVVHVLEEFFEKDHDAAIQVMLDVHNHGSGECGVYSHDAAAAKAAQVMDFAHKHQHPLRCVLQAN